MKTEREEEVKSSGPYLMICTLHTFLKHRPYAEWVPLVEIAPIAVAPNLKPTRDLQYKEN